MFVCAPACGWTFACSAPKSSLARSIASLLDLVDDLAAAVVAPARVALGVLVRRHASRRASKIAGHVKFSEAISSIWPRWRSSSRPSSSAISGSISASPAVRSCSNVSCATAIARDAYSAAHACRSGSVRQRALERRGGTAPSRRTRGSAPVQSSTVDGVPGSSPPSRQRGSRRGSRPGRPRASAAPGLPGRFALVAATAPTSPSTSAPRPRELRDAHADRARAPSPSASGSAVPGSAARACTGPAGARSDGRSARSSGTQLEERVEVAREQRDRLLGRAPLQPVDPRDGGLAVRVAQSP